MKAIAAHFKYISKNGRLEIESERGEMIEGREALRDLAQEWRLGGILIDDIGHRREAFIMLSMPRGVDPLYVLNAARAFAQAELSGHKYVWVPHDHQANPHVHLSVRAESRHGKRLNPRKADLQRWRATFSEKLRELGIDAEATRQSTRGQTRNYEPLWRLKAREEGRLRTRYNSVKSSVQPRATRAEAVESWRQLGQALAASADAGDLALAQSIATFVQEMPATRTFKEPGRDSEVTHRHKAIDFGPTR